MFFSLEQSRRRWKPYAIQSLAPAVGPVVTSQRVDDVVLPDLDNSLRLRIQLDDRINHLLAATARGYQGIRPIKISVVRGAAGGLSDHDSATGSSFEKAR